jgi:hypothetical protein
MYRQKVFWKLKEVFFSCMSAASEEGARGVYIPETQKLAVSVLVK